MPLVFFASNVKGFSHLEPKNYDFTQSLLVLNTLEFVIGVLILFILSLIFKKYDFNKIRKSKEYHLSGSYSFYSLFVFLTLVLYFVFPGASDLINFFYIEIDSTGERAGDVTDTKLVLIRQLFIASVAIIFLVSASICHKKNNSNLYIRSNNYYLYLSIIFAILTVSIIVGERRTAQIYTAFSSILVLITLFESQKKKIIFLIITPAIAIISLMSIYKFFGAFMYGSYLEAISNVKADSIVSSLMQIYFFGPQNITLANDFFEHLNVGQWGDPSRFIFDVTRSIFGPSFLLKSHGTLTSEVFNHYIYETNVPTGQVLSSMSLSIIYFGYYFFFVMFVFNIVLSVLLELVFRITLSIEVKYIFSVFLIRMISNLYGPTPALISFISMTALTLGLVFAVSYILRKIGFR